MSEQCWNIKETRPVKISTMKTDCGRIVITIAPMLMTYATWNHLDHNHVHGDYKEKGFNGKGKIGVGYTSYDYRDGECTFIAQSKKDLDLWLERYKGIIIA